MADIPAQVVNIIKSLKIVCIDREVYAKLPAKGKLQAHPSSWSLRYQFPATQSVIKFADTVEAP